ncbi:MAG: hypothetical protein ACLQE9_01385 [Roseiarcus sp.]
MAETTQLAFSFAEVAAALIKEQGIHTGKWTLSFELGFAAGLFGPTPADLKPGAATLIQRVILAHAGEGMAPHLVFDAAEINPAKTSSRERATKKKPAK